MRERVSEPSVAHRRQADAAEVASSRAPLRPDVATLPRVLVAEDDPAMRELLVSALRSDGFAVVEARNGDELIDRLEQSATAGEGGRSSIALVVSDVRMPGLSGLDVLAALRCAFWDTPVVLITAFSSEETRREAYRLGALAVFDKPFAFEDLSALARITLGGVMAATRTRPCS